MPSINDIRKREPYIVSLGSHPGIIQSILDYDFLIKRDRPSVIAIIASGRKQERYFWGESEVTIPVVSAPELLNTEAAENCNTLLNVQSARRVLSSTKQALSVLKNVKLLTIFAEQTPESHTLELIKIAQKKNLVVTGPSSVGILLPGYMKLGAIGGTQHEQISNAHILDSGDTAVVSTSGGIVNELIHVVTGAGLGVSFAIALGGDRFPVTSPLEALLLAEDDEQTQRIVYFGELGGTDEYEIAKSIKSGRIKKEVIVYIAGIVAELFETPPQFGHAKAFAENKDESANAKKTALAEVGVIVCNSFADIEKTLKDKVSTAREPLRGTIGMRQKAMMVSHISGEKDGAVRLLGKDLLETIDNNTIASLILSMLLGHQVTSEKSIAFVDHVFKLLVDHGPYVSGAVNTIVAARAGKDLVTSLSAGLLTIGPRFGGAINASSGDWLDAVVRGVTPIEFVESFARKGEAIPGIGHKKYTTDDPDPRVGSLTRFRGNKNNDRYLNFALAVEAITTTKKSNLILNVDGAIGAVLLDILESELNYSPQELKELVEIEFFNALFVLSRSVGFVSHYLDQRKHDEGLFRLSPDDVRYIDLN